MTLADAQGLLANGIGPATLIEELRGMGFEVRVRHERIYDPDKQPIPTLLKLFSTGLDPRVPEATGGETLAEVVGDHVYLTGVAQCHPKDNYNRKIGALLALGRVLEVVEP